jgi:hypothetical protein
VRATAEPPRGEVPARRHLKARRGISLRPHSPPFSSNRTLGGAQTHPDFTDPLELRRLFLPPLWFAVETIAPDRVPAHPELPGNAFAATTLFMKAKHHRNIVRFLHQLPLTSVVRSTCHVSVPLISSRSSPQTRPRHAAQTGR